MAANSEILSTLEFLKVVGKCKNLKRTGWVRKGVDEPETVASHMYRMAVMGMLLPQSADIDKSRVIKMALVHDMAEAIVGDITPHCGVSQTDKYTLEKQALLKMTDHISNRDIAEEIISLWQEYEDASTDVAKMVKDFDKFDMVLQAYEYENNQSHIGGGGLNEFFTSTEGIMKTEMVKGWDEALREKRTADLKSSKQPDEPSTS